MATRLESRSAATFVLAVGVRVCVATANPNLRWAETLEEHCPSREAAEFVLAPGVSPG